MPTNLNMETNRFHLILKLDGSLESHKMLNSIHYVDFMLLSNEMVDQALAEGGIPQDCVLWFATKDEVKAYCYKHGVDWLCNFQTGGSRVMESTFLELSAAKIHFMS